MRQRCPFVTQDMVLNTGTINDRVAEALKEGITPIRRN
jgi:hypothetical protein